MALANVCTTAGRGSPVARTRSKIVFFDPIFWGPSTKNATSWPWIFTRGWWLADLDQLAAAGGSI